MSFKIQLQVKFPFVNNYPKIMEKNQKKLKNYLRVQEIITKIGGIQSVAVDI